MASWSEHTLALDHGSSGSQVLSLCGVSWAPAFVSCPFFIDSCRELDWHCAWPGRGPRGQSRLQREPFPVTARERRPAAIPEGPSSVIVRQLQSIDKEAVTWLRSEAEAALHVSKIIRVIESIEDRLRSESYNGYAGNIWEADDPISNTIKEKQQELQTRMMDLERLLEKPSQSLIDELADGFYLLFSVMHILLLNRETPEFCEGLIAKVMGAAAVVGMNHGKQPHVVLACTTDHLRDAETDSVLLAFQHVLYKVIDNDVDGQKLFGTAHRVLDAQMDILENRDDEETVISALNIIGIICLRHPQAFKTRFWDLMDLFFGSYVEALPSDRVFEASVAAFALFREKFKQEIDFAMKITKTFTEDMEAAVKSFQNAGAEGTDPSHYQASFLATLQLFALVYHAVGEKLRGTSRAPPDRESRAAVKSNLTIILKGLNQIVQVSSPGFSSFCTRVNRTLVVIMGALGGECVSIGNLLFLYARVQQASAFKVPNVAQLHGEFVESIFRLVAAIIRAVGDQFPREAAKDLLGPDSIIFTASRLKIYTGALRGVFDALFLSPASGVKEFVFRVMGQDYHRALTILSTAHSDGNSLTKMMELQPSNTSIGSNPVRKSLPEKSFERADPLPSSNPLARIKLVYEDKEVFLSPEGADEPPQPEGVTGVHNADTLGKIYRDKAMLYLFCVQLCLAAEQPVEQEFADGCYRVLIKDMDATWAFDFPDLLVAHMFVAKALWQKKCAALVVKELMKNAGSVLSIAALDKELIRDTLVFLDAMLVSSCAEIVFPVILDWSSEALSTLIAFNAPLRSLGIETEYFRIVTHLFGVVLSGKSPYVEVTATVLFDLLSAHWSVLGLSLASRLFELSLQVQNSALSVARDIAELLIYGAPLQTVIKHEYDMFRENPSLLQMEMHPGNGIKKDPQYSWLRKIPTQDQQRIWQRAVFQNMKQGSGDSRTTQLFLRHFFGLQEQKSLTEAGQLLRSAGIPDCACRNAELSERFGYFSVAADIANSVCHEKLSGVFGTVDSVISLTGILSQVFSPVVFDHSSFLHKTLLELYIAMKDASLDVVDEWEEIKRLTVEKSEEGGDAEIAFSSAAKTTQKGRIYSRLGGITAQDISAPPVSWLDVQLHLCDLLQFAELLEKTIERMMYGSAVHSNSMSDDDWLQHMRIVKDSYSSEEQMTKWKALLDRLRTQMVRIALALEDDYALLRLGYPILLKALEAGQIVGVSLEELAVKILWSIVRLENPHLVRLFSSAAEACEVETGVSDTCFFMAECMAEQRETADGLFDQETPDFNELEGDFRAECFAKLNNWKGLLGSVNSEDELGPHAARLHLFAAVTTMDVSQNEQNYLETVEKVREMLRGDVTSRVEGAEVAAHLIRLEPQSELASEAIASLHIVQKLDSARGMARVSPRPLVLMHVLERLSSAATWDDRVARFPLVSTPILDISSLEISATHSVCRWLCGNHNFSPDSPEREACWDPELFLSVLKFGRRTENPSLVQGYLKDYFGHQVYSDDDSSNSDLDMLGKNSSALTKLLIRASETTMCVRELSLVLEGAKFLVDNADQPSRIQALKVARQINLDSFRLIEDTPGDAVQCMVQVAKSLRFVDKLHRSDVGLGEDDGNGFGQQLKDFVGEVRVRVGNTYEQAGFAPGLFVENPSFAGFVNAHEMESGIVAEMAYMAHCVEGTYTQPALHFGNWCYQQACRALASLTKIRPEEIIDSVGFSHPELDISFLTPDIVSHVVQVVVDNFPVRLNRQAVKAVVETMKDSIVAAEVLIIREFPDADTTSREAVAAVVEYCRHHYLEVVEFFVQAVHVYFVYLRKPATTDNVTVVLTRLLELLTAMPDVIHEVWMDELTKHDIAVWRVFLPQLFGRLHHPNSLVIGCVSEVIVRLAGRFPAEVLYPLTAGVMASRSQNIGGGMWCPGLDDHQRYIFASSCENLLETLRGTFAYSVENAVSFATEIQRISLLWEERWLHYLLSQQASLKRQIKSAIKEGLSGHSAAGRRPGECVEDEEESVTEEGQSSYSEIEIGFNEKALNELFDEPALVVNGEKENETKPVDAEDGAAGSRGGTPEETDAADEPEGEAKKGGKRWLRFPLYEQVPWRTAFDLSKYQKSVEPALRRLRSLVEVTARPSETGREADFVEEFQERLANAVEKMTNPPSRTEFDEEVVWAPFADILARLEARQAAKKKNRLSIGNISRLDAMPELKSLPMPGWHADGDVVTIESVEQDVEVLPTKTKPKKIVLRGSDGFKHMFLCKGLEDLTQDALIMQFLDVSGDFIKREFKHEKDIPRVRTYSVLPMGPRAGLIQWVGGSISLLALYRSHLERESFLGRQIFAINEEAFVEVPVYGQTKTKNDALPQTVTFRVAEEELQDVYENIQDAKHDAAQSDGSKSNSQLEKGEASDEFEKWVGSDDDFSPTDYVDEYYTTITDKSKGELKQFHRNDDAPVRVHPHIHELYMSFLVKSLRKDNTIAWDKFRLHEQNRTKDIDMVHLKATLEGLMAVTPNEMLEREMRLACSSSEEWWKVNRSFAKSLAMTSMLGYILGLGDRHPDNILVDFHTGEVVHVDYNVSFEKGLRLSVPERVPYRMTPNLVCALGPEGVAGIFRDVALRTLEVLRKNQPTFSLLMSSYVTDPFVDWTTDKSEAIGLNPSRRDASQGDRESINEKAEMFSLKVWIRVREKLLGHDGADGARLDVSSQVDRTIAQATDLSNLARMFEGWVAWL